MIFELIIYIKVSFNFKLLQYYLKYMHLDFVGQNVSLTQQVLKIDHALPSALGPQVNDHFLVALLNEGYL